MVDVSIIGADKKRLQEISQEEKTFGTYLLKPKNGFEDYLLEPFEVFYFLENLSIVKDQYKFFVLIVPSIIIPFDNYYSLIYEKNNNRYCNIDSKYFYLNSCLNHLLFLLPHYKRRLNNDLKLTFEHPWTIRPKEKLRKYKLNNIINL